MSGPSFHQLDGRRLAQRTASGAVVAAMWDRILRVVTLNTASLQAHFEAAVALPADVNSTQKTRLGKAADRSMASQLFSRRWQAFGGIPPPSVNVHMERLCWWVGVGCLPALDLPSRFVPPVSPAYHALWDTGRWCHVEVAYGCEQRTLSVDRFSGDGRLTNFQSPSR